MVRLLIALMLLLVATPSPAWAQRVERKGKLFFSNIAPGELESDVIRKFPAKVMLLSESGIPYGGVYVRVFNASGIAIFKYLCEKPWLFLKIPPGDYNVVGVDRKKITRLKQFTVKNVEDAQTVVKLSWPKNVVGY